MYLLDTNVVSELRRTRPNRAVVAWLSDIPAEQLFLSAVTLGELQAGVEITRQQDPEKAEEIEAWVDTVAATNEVLSVDGVIFRRWAKLMHRQSDDLIEDALIAATALATGASVATRDTAGFAGCGLMLIDPWTTR